MKELFEYLKNIHELLEQIYTITDNQTTVLLAPMEETTNEEEDSFKEESSLDMITQMSDYKEELTEQLMKAEDLFQKEYDKCKHLASSSEEVMELKRLVSGVLERKEAVVEHEQSNMLLLKSRSKRTLEVVHLPQNPIEVSNAYKKQQKIT